MSETVGSLVQLSPCEAVALVRQCELMPESQSVPSEEVSDMSQVRKHTLPFLFSRPLLRLLFGNGRVSQLVDVYDVFPEKLALYLFRQIPSLDLSSRTVEFQYGPVR